MIDHDDAALLAERVGQLEAEKTALIAERDRLVTTVRSLRRHVSARDTVLRVLRGLALFVPVWLLGGLTGKWLLAPTIVSHCYVDRSAGYVDRSAGSYRTHLWGNVEWARDVHMGVYEDIEKAAAAAKAVGCPLLQPPAAHR